MLHTVPLFPLYLLYIAFCLPFLACLIIRSMTDSAPLAEEGLWILDNAKNLLDYVFAKKFREVHFMFPFLPGKGWLC
jgi:hypothetical protein